MTPEKKEAVQKALDDTMTVSQAKQRKLDLRAKELEIRQGTLDRKKQNDAAAQERRDAAAKKKEGSAATDAISRRKKKKADIEAKKLDRIKGIAAKRKAGVDKSLARAKQVSKTGRSSETIDKDEGEGSAEVKMMKGAIGAGFAGARTGLNLAKAGAKALGSAPSRMKAGSLQRKADRKQKKIDDRNEKLVAAQDKKVSDRLNRRRMSKVKSTVGKLNPFRSKSSGAASTDTAAEKRSTAKERNDSAKTKSASKVIEKPKALNPAKPTKKSAASDPLAKAAPNVKKPTAPTKASAAKDPLARASSNKPVRPARRALPPAGGVNKPTTQAKPSAAGKMSDAERARKDPKFRRELIAKRNKGMNEEFYQYLMEIERMEKKTDKVIDIMKGKNKIEISPKISEEVTGGILVQDAEDYKPLEIETVDVIKAEPLQEYSALVRQGIKVGGKKGGRAVQAGEKAAIAKGQKMKADAAKGSAEAGKGEKIGSVVGGVAGGLAGGILDGPLPVGDIVGGIAGSKIGGAIGKKFDKKPVKEEASDAMKDRRMERGGVGGNVDYSKAPKYDKATAEWGKKKPKKGGPSAMDIVRADIEKKYGKGAIMDTKKTKKESFSDWRGELDIQEFIKFTDAAKRRAEWRKNHPTGGDFTKWKPGVDVPGVSNDLKVEPFKAGSNVNPVTYKDKPVTADMAKDYAGKKLSQAGDAVKGAAKSVVDYATKNPGKAAAIGAGVVGAGLLAKKVLGGDKKKEKEQNEHNDWRSELNYVEEGEGKKDACYKKVKASAKVWPSAYASGRLVQCRKKGAANYGNSKKD